MSETQVKINNDTLEITNVRVHQYSREQLEVEKQMALDRMARVQKWLDGVNAKLAVLNG